jgi:hypothetical protein
LLQGTIAGLARAFAGTHIAGMAVCFRFRVSVQRRTKPIGTYGYIITRTDDPDWGETTGEYFFTREAASAAGRAALDRILKRQAPRPDRAESLPSSR